ncbi:MAG: GTP 3',8-cyclase MoaA [Pirellulales bacterium]|nr:GTP 3',8-cyclase MoaA [Pirellulales bacterium]
MPRHFPDADFEPPLVDGFGRRHSSLRLSVTDRCNIRCFYCMPVDVVFRPRQELLTFEEMERFVRAVVPLGVTKIRLTGGEPLVRHELHKLVAMLLAIEGLEDVALTTNGMLLAQQASDLKQAGLQRINVSLDTLRDEVFRQITRREGLQRVVEGIDAAQLAGFERIRLNAVSIRGLTEAEIVPLARFARERNLELRFIEFMPLDADRHWSPDQLLSGADVRRVLEAQFGQLVPAPRPDPSQPAVDFRFADGRGGIGLINPVSEPFCGDCNRLRLTAEGQLRNCLFSTVEWDARRLLRSGANDAELRRLVRSCVAAKAAAHGIGQPDFHRPERPMYQIGG